MASSSAGSGLFSSLLGPEPSSSRPSEPSTSNSIEAIVADPLGWVMRQEAAGQVRDFVEGLWGKVNESSVVQKAKDHVERARADWYWHGRRLGTREQRVPLGKEIDERSFLALASLARVVHEQIMAHGVDGLVQFCPVTCSVAGLAVGAFLWPEGLPLRPLCLSPYMVVEHGEWQRLLTPALLHLDTAHLAANLAGALPECAALEQGHPGGTLGFAAEVVGLTAASHGIYVVWAWGQKKAFGRGSEYYSVGAVGLSSLSFALQVLSGERRGGRVLLLGVIPMPARFTWAAQLLLTTLCSPESSFPGHLAGVAAGLLYVYGVAPVVRALSTVLRGGQPASSTAAQTSPYFYGAGTTGGRTLAPQGSIGGGLWGRMRSGWKRWALDLGSQLALVAAAAAVHVLVLGGGSRKGGAGGGGRRPINSWQW